MSDILPSSAAYRPPRLHGGGWSPETKRRLMFAGGIVGVLAIGAAIVPLINGIGASGPVPVIEADPRPIRSKPENPGGLQLSSIRPEEMEGADSLVEPEMPNAAALRAYTPADPQDGAVIPGLATPRAITHRQAEAYEPPFRPAPTKPVTSATQAVPTQATPTQTPAAPGTATPPVTPPARAGKATAQIAALQSETAAQAEWGSLRRRMPDLLASRQASFQKTERDGRVFWRVRTGGFADLAEARGFCEKLRARGATCIASES